MHQLSIGCGVHRLGADSCLPILNTTLDRLLTAPPVLQPEARDWLQACFRTIQSAHAGRIFEMQFDMVRRLEGAEAGIRKAAARKEAILQEIRDAAKAKDIDAVKLLQGGLRDADVEVASGEYFRNATKLVGDDYAFRWIDADILKHFALKPNPGYISGKDGLQAELHAAISFAKQGYFVLLNDLTHAVKGGDLTLLKNGKLTFFEVNVYSGHRERPFRAS